MDLLKGQQSRVKLSIRCYIMVWSLCYAFFWNRTKSQIFLFDPKILTVAPQFWKPKVSLNQKLCFIQCLFLFIKRKERKVAAWDNLSLAINLNQEKKKKNFKLNSGTSFFVKTQLFLLCVTLDILLHSP